MGDLIIQFLRGNREKKKEKVCDTFSNSKTNQLKYGIMRLFGSTQFTVIGSATCVVCSTLLAVYLLLPDKKYKHIPYLKFFVNKPKNLEYVRAKLETGELP